MMGVLLVKDKNGLIFKIGTGFSDAERKDPPKNGTIITFKFQGLTNDGKYRFPAYMRVHQGVWKKTNEKILIINTENLEKLKINLKN